MKILTKHRIAFSVAAFTLLASAAWAQGTSEERSACMGDAFRFCSAFIPNVTAIENCLRQNVNNLTPACRAEFEPNNRTRIQERHFQQQ